jgi:amino acid adenylation domain-containing protein
MYLLHDLLTHSAARLPNKVAARFEDQALTYHELDAMTNQLARALRGLGVRRGDRVGIYVPKSVASIVSVFGILKAGGIYVPLDPNAPAKRLAYITRNCDINVLVTSGEKMASLAEFFVEGTPLNSIVVTDNQEHEPVELPSSVQVLSWDEVRVHETEPVPASNAIETDLAYILYTSGSTGEPKGVMIAHRTALTFIIWCCDTFRMTADDVVTSHAPLHFDLSSFDLFSTIKAGGTIVLVPERHSVFPMQLADLLEKERVSVTYLVPSVLSMLVNYGTLAAHDFSALRLVLFAGEVFPIKYLRHLVATIPHVDYYNLYGPTETNVCTYYKVQTRDVSVDRTQPVPIGKACENIEVFAIGDKGQLVTEPGQQGELWVRGSCVAQGYWGDPQKTARHFVRNTFQPHFQEIAYRTGDIVVLDEDGVNWLYIGRSDHMIKSRGYRIELGEIETAFYCHSGVKEVGVVAVPDELVGNRLKAFVVAHDTASLTAKDLLAYCSLRLPRYMIPESIEFCDELPRTSTGKLDRTELASTEEAGMRTR